MRQAAVVEPLALQHVWAVHAGGVNPDQHFVGFRPRHGATCGSEDIGAAGAGDFDYAMSAGTGESVSDMFASERQVSDR